MSREETEAKTGYMGRRFSFTILQRRSCFSSRGGLTVRFFTTKETGPAFDADG
jgi:hypothetical protein